MLVSPFLCAKPSMQHVAKQWYCKGRLCKAFRARLGTDSIFKAVCVSPPLLILKIHGPIWRLNGIQSQWREAGLVACLKFPLDGNHVLNVCIPKVLFRTRIVYDPFQCLGCIFLYCWRNHFVLIWMHTAQVNQSLTPLPYTWGQLRMTEFNSPVDLLGVNPPCVALGKVHRGPRSPPKEGRSWPLYPIPGRLSRESS